MGIRVVRLQSDRFPIACGSLFERAEPLLGNSEIVVSLRRLRFAFEGAAKAIYRVRKFTLVEQRGAQDVAQDESARKSFDQRLRPLFGGGKLSGIVECQQVLKVRLP